MNNTKEYKNNIEETSKPGLNIVKSEIPEKVTAANIYEWFHRLTKINKKKFIVTDEALDLVNESISNPEFDGFKFIDTMITYQSALANDRVNFLEYINAIRFCAFLEANEGNITDAYIKAFIHRDFVKTRYTQDTNSEAYRQLASAAARYRKSPVVINILTQAEVPLYLMFQGYRYKAVQRLVYEMEKAPLAKDRVMAADKLLFHLKPPENLKIELDVGVKQDNIVNQYESMLENMVKEQKKLLANGMDLKSVANSKETFVDIVVENEK